MGSYYDYASLDEVTITAVGNTAEVATAGMNFAAIIKSGTNEFHGRYFGAYQNRRMQSDNLDAALMERGVTQGSSFKDYSDISGSLGGPIWRDRIWFYGDYKRQRKAQNEVNFALDGGPDGIYLTPDDTTEDGRGDGRRELNSQTIKTTFQLSQGYRMDAFYHRSGKVMPERYGTQFRPLETTNDYCSTRRRARSSSTAHPAADSSTRSPWDATTTWPTTSRGPASTPPPASTASRACTPARRHGPTGAPQSLAIPGKRHLLSGRRPRHQDRRPDLPGDARHGPGQPRRRQLHPGVRGSDPVRYRDGGNPYRVRLFNYPLDPTNRVDVNSAYVTDEWRVSRRLTANIGLRFDHYASYVPEQFKGPDDFGLFFQGQVDRLDVVDWKGLAPRIGLAYDLRGDGRTVIRGAYNYFQQSLGDSFASTYNLNAIASATYDWNDSIPDNTYTPGEVDLSLNGPDFVSITGAANSILPNDPKYGRELYQSNTQELSLGVQHELMPSVAARAVYVYKRERVCSTRAGRRPRGRRAGRTSSARSAPTPSR